MRRRRPPADLTLREIEALYRAGYPTFVRVVTGIVGNEETARDAVHDGERGGLAGAGRARPARADSRGPGCATEGDGTGGRAGSGRAARARGRCRRGFGGAGARAAGLK